MKYILITGCSNNSIGSAMAKSFSKHPNLHIIATSRKTTSMSDLASYPNISLLSLDVTSPTSISDAVAATKAQTNGTLDYLVNYAGTGYTMPFLDTDIDTAQKMFDVNVWGVMRVTQAFAPLLIKSKGMIVMAGSTAELVNLPFQSVYCASKAALRMVSESLRLEVAGLGVRILYVTTGNIVSNWYVSSIRCPYFSFFSSLLFSHFSRLLFQIVYISMLYHSRNSHTVLGLTIYPNSSFRRTPYTSQSKNKSRLEPRANSLWSG